MKFSELISNLTQYRRGIQCSSKWWTEIQKKKDTRHERGDELLVRCE